MYRLIVVDGIYYLLDKVVECKIPPLLIFNSKNFVHSNKVIRVKTAEKWQEINGV